MRLRAGALTDGDVIEFIQRSWAAPTGAELAEIAQTISQLTGGNAFLVCELWRALVETGLIEDAEGKIRLTRPLAELGTPESVREVVSQRLARLAPATTELLEFAATAGAEFELELMRRGTGSAEHELVSALDEAVRSGIIEELSRPRLAYRFTHELVRRAVYDQLTGVRRAERHLRVGEALEAAAGGSAVLPDLAHHFAAAAPLGGTQRAIKYSVLAARSAIGALAFDEAAALLRTALELGVDEPGEHAELLLELGTVTHRAGKAFEAVDAFASAAHIARDLQDPELLARAAIGYEDASWRPGLIRDPVSLLEEATATLGDRPSELRVGLLSGLARARHARAAHTRLDHPR